MKNFILLALTSLVLFACNNSSEETKEVAKTEESKDYTELFTKAKAIFGVLPKYAINEKNPMTPEKLALGKKLYFDVRLSKDNTMSCNTCHNLETGGVDNLPVSPGNDEGTFGTRNSPTVLNAALHMAQFWDGRNADVEEQAGGPILNPVEMAIPDEQFLLDRLSKIEEYQEMFKNAYPADEDPIKFVNIQNAIGVFERNLMTPSKFDDFLAGNQDAMTTEEKEGLKTFLDVGCVSCHLGNGLGGNMYQKFGVYGNYWDYTKSEKIDEGRFEHTEKESDKYIFKVPTLRNVALTHPYFHDGSVNDLDEAIRIMGKAQLNKDLTDEQVKSIHTFFDALTGEVPEEFMN